MHNNNQPESKAQQVVSLLRKFHQKMSSKRRLSLIALLVAILLGGLSVLILFESSYYFSGWVKTASLLLFAILSAATVYRFSKRHQGDSFRSFYEHFFESQDQDAVLSAIDLYLDDSQKKSVFYKAAISANLKSVNTGELSSDLKNFVKDSRISNLFWYSSGALLFSLVLVSFIIVSMPSESLRTVHFWNGYAQPNPYAFTITPADTTVEHGAEASVSIRFEDDLIPDETVLEFKTSVEENYRQRQMQQTKTGVFESSGIDLTNDISYRVSMDGFHSDEYTIDVQLQPRFDELTASVTPPSYTQLSKNVTQYPFSEINLYPGSELTIQGVTNKPVEFIRVNKDGENAGMELVDSTENRYQFTFAPEQTDTLTFQMKDLEGLENRNPFRTVVNVKEDQYPVIRIQEPTGTVMETEPSELEIIYEATDDFGLSRAQLVWSHQRAFMEEAQTGSVRLGAPPNGSAQMFRWNLEEFDLRPRDRLQFSIRVWDNDAVAGAKMSESQQVALQIPSLTEYFDELDEREQDVQGDLDQISEEFQNMEQEYQEFMNQLRQNPEAGFEEQQELREIRERQQQIDETVKNLNEKFQQLQSEIEQSNRISDETQRAYRELQQLMQELDDPALQKAMEELQKALENLSPQELEQALENVEFNENLYRERLQRTVELFKRLKMNSDLDKLARQYEDMAERMSPKENQSLEQLNDEMKTVNEDMESVSEQLEELDSNPPKNSEQRLKELKESSRQQLDSTRTQLEQMQEQAGEEMEQGSESSPSEEMQQQQQQISQQLQNEAEKFQQSIQQMSGQQIQVNILALQQSLYTLLELSEMQEYLSQTVSDTRSRSQGYVELARIQQNVNDQFTAVADTLFEVSSEIPGIPNQINRKKEDVERRLNQSIEQMVDRNQRGATVATRESLGGINDLTSMIASLLDQLMNMQGGGAGKGMTMQQMVQQLQNMSGNQQQLNQQLQQLINDVQGDRLSREQSERLDQIARQQNQIRKQLEEMQRSGTLQQGDRLLSELQRMMEDMEDSINDMRGGVTDPLMVERQQNILSRMLSAEQAMQQRGEEENEREGTTRSEFDRILPPDITLEELQQEIRARMQDPDFTRFSERYQRLIEQYFERLRRLEQESLP